MMIAVLCNCVSNIVRRRYLDRDSMAFFDPTVDTEPFSDLAVRFVTISGTSKEARAKADCASKQLSVSALACRIDPYRFCGRSRAPTRNSLINLEEKQLGSDLWFEHGKCPSLQWHRNPLSITILSQRTHQFSLVLPTAQRLEIILSARPTILIICRRFI